MVAAMMKWHRQQPAQKCQIQDYQYKDRLSVCTLLLLQRKSTLGHTKPLHAALEHAGVDAGFHNFGPK